MIAFKPITTPPKVHNDNIGRVENLLDNKPVLKQHFNYIMVKPTSTIPVNFDTGRFKVGNPYQVKGVTYIPRETYHYTEVGMASWYGPDFHGKKTANGETFNQYAMTAAHRTLQLPSLVKVTNLENLKSVIVRINDRGPFKDDRIIDLSKGAADELGFKFQGLTKVKIEVLPDESKQLASIAKMK